MMTVHIWPGGERIIAAPVNDYLHIFYVINVDRLGRASVPLLSIFSGILFAVSFSKGISVTSLVKRTFNSLIVPTIFWSAPMLMIIIAGKVILNDSSNMPDSVFGWINALTGIYGYAANAPLHFLREIFVMVLYASIVLLAWERSKFLGLLLMFLIVAAEHNGSGFVLFRNQIATFFFFGVLLAKSQNANWTPSWALCGILFVINELSLRINPGPHARLAPRSTALVCSPSIR